ncbi:MAG: 4Fe-4S binding protein [Longimicrobiales bacterium]|nr:4Fe-4S binding protein [Longimicrobiales bacterium]
MTERESRAIPTDGSGDRIPGPGGSLPDFLHPLFQILLLALTLLAGGQLVHPPGVAAQSSTYVTQSRLESVFPGAERFSEKEGEPPVYRAYAVDPDTGEETLLGFVFQTEDVPPEREGYNAPIRTLVGMDLEGVLTGIRVMSYRESLRGSRGDFLGRPGVQGQFAGKSIRDRFRVRDDVRNVTGATITVRAMAEGIRNAARRVAAAYLLQPEESGEGSAPHMGTLSVDELEPMLWAEMVALGLVVEVSGEVGRERPLRVSLAYLRDRPMVEAFFGTARIEELIADARAEAPEGHLFFLGLNGPDVIIFSMSRIWFVQGGDTIRVERSDFETGGRRTSGKAGGLFDRAGLLAVGPELDVRRPFTLVVDLERDRGTVWTEYRAFPDREAVAGSGGAANAGATADGGAVPDAEPVLDAGPAANAEAAGNAAGAIADAGAAVSQAGEASEGGEASEAGTTTDVVEAGELAGVVGDDQAERDGEGQGDGRGEGGRQAEGGGRAEGGDESQGSDQTEAAAEGTEPARADELVADGELAFDFTEEELAALLVEEDEEESLLAVTLAQTYWPRVISLVLLLVLVTAAFVAKTKPALRWLALAGTLGFLGYVDGGFLSVSHIVAGISAGPGVFLEDLSLLILASFTVVTTLFVGRVFCGYLCPFGALQDILDRVVPRRFRRELPRAIHERALWVKYGVLAVVLAPAILGIPATVYHWFEPFGTVFFWSSSMALWAIAGGILVASAVVPRFYCRYACPLGAALALGSLASPFRIRRVEQCTLCRVCERKCPTGAIRREKIDFKECVRCNECEIQLLHRTGVCKHDMDEIRPRLVQMSTPSSRRGA